MSGSDDLDVELTVAERALTHLRAEMDDAVYKQGGVPREQAEEFVERMQTIKDKIAFLKQAIAARAARI